jgi:hypothetical protein
MKKILYSALGAVAIGALLSGAAFGQTSPANSQPTAPQVSQINSVDLIKIIPGGFGQALDYYAAAPLLGNYATTLPGNNPGNALIGGDFYQNLFQDGTTVGSITTAVTYVADGWFAFSGTSTTLAGAQETGSPDTPASFDASLRITRSGSGVIQSCVGQIVKSQDTYRYQGQTVEFDFHALAGSGFSAASSNVSVLLVTGTGTNDTAVNLGKTVNSALSGTAWAGAATSTVTMPISTTWTRYSAVFPVPSTATEMAVLICYTPVGASPSSDYFEFTGAQLVPNSALASVAGTAGAALNANDPRAKSFNRRLLVEEQKLEYSEYFRVNETATARPFLGQVLTTSTANIKIPFPTPMWKAPTPAYVAGGWSVTVAAGTSGANQVCGTLAAVASTTTPYGSTALCTATSGIVAGNATEFIGTLTTGSAIFSARL